MDKRQALALIDKYTQGNCTPAEKQLVEQHFFDFLNNRPELPSAEAIEKDNVEMSDLLQNYITNNKPAVKIKRIWPRIAAIAAAILLVISAGLYVKVHTSASLQMANDVAPGTNSATLTLANGKTIILNKAANGRLAMQGNVAVIKTAAGQLDYHAGKAINNELLYNTITTRRSEQYDVILSDGTHVWLDAASSIKFPVVFATKDRYVEITGEAYFEVAHDASKPFKVKSDGQTVEVLGTHFNINAYTDEPSAKTSLLEGRVKISGDKGQGEKILEPGDQALLTRDKISVSKTNTEADIAWKNGAFIFNDESLESIMRKVARWYDVDIVYDNVDKTQYFGGDMTRFVKVSQVLKKLELTGGVHFKVEGRRITVSK